MSSLALWIDSWPATRPHSAPKLLHARIDVPLQPDMKRSAVRAGPNSSTFQYLARSPPFASFEQSEFYPFERTHCQQQP